MRQLVPGPYSARSQFALLALLVAHGVLVQFSGRLLANALGVDGVVLLSLGVAYALILVIPFVAMYYRIGTDSDRALMRQTLSTYNAVGIAVGGAAAGIVAIFVSLGLFWILYVSSLATPVRVTCAILYVVLGVSLAALAARVVARRGSD
jgi:hypothetical protein